MFINLLCGSTVSLMSKNSSSLALPILASVFETFLDFYEVEYDDGFQKIIHQSKIRDQDTANKVSIDASLVSCCRMPVCRMPCLPAK